MGGTALQEMSGLFLGSVWLSTALIFQAPSYATHKWPHTARSKARRRWSTMIDSIAPPADTTMQRSIQSNGLYSADRYVSTVRFLIPKDEQVAFEHTWTERADELAAAPGMRYFQMSKRAADFMGPPLPDDEFNYQSFCVWDSKAASEACDVDFSKDAGCEANYDGLFALALPPSISGVPASNRTISDQTARLPREAFVASNRFGIKPGFERDFEDMWAARDSSLADLPGFVNFQLLRREGEVDDGNTYVSYTTWKNVQAFNSWRNSENFKRSHSNSRGDKESPYAKMPKVVTFQTFLVVSADDGM